jgi:hypothetical protein
VVRPLRAQAIKFNLYSKSGSVPLGSQLPFFEDFCFKICKSLVGGLRKIERVIECRVQIVRIGILDPQHPAIMRHEHKTFETVNESKNAMQLLLLWCGATYAKTFEGCGGRIGERYE